MAAQAGQFRFIQQNLNRRNLKQNTSVSHMKNSTLVSAALLGLGLAFQADAANVVYITGSTAFRSAAFLSIKASFDGGNPEVATRGGSAADGSNGSFMLFHGNVGGAE